MSLKSPQSSSGQGRSAQALTVAAVVIGRNEGARIASALGSVRAEGLRQVYVDSGSRDASVSIARDIADAVHELDPASPFSAARARNEGRVALSAFPDPPEVILFLDGDCALLPGFVEAGVTAMAADPRLAIVTGHLREANPDASPYNRLCALEWGRAAGEITNFDAMGGIMLVRASAFDAVDGFNPEMIAGEDPDFAIRVSNGGNRVRKLDVPMATHDANITRFGQWWTRAVRAGHALAQRYDRHGRTPRADSRRQWRSTLFWGMGVPLIMLIFLYPSRGLSLVLLGGYGLLFWRMNRHYRHLGWSPADARLGAAFGLLAKFANAWGIVRYRFNRLRGRYRLIEYK